MRKGPGAAGGDRSRPEGIALGGRGLPQGLPRLRVCRDIRVARQRVQGLMARTICSRMKLPPPWANPQDGEIITHAPNLMWGTDGVRVFTVDDGWGPSPPSSIGTPSVSAGMSASAAASPPCSRSSHGACRAVWLDRGRRGSGAGLADGSRSQYLSDSPTRSTGASRPAFVPSPRPRLRRAVQSHAEGTDHPWSHLPQHRGAAGRRPRLRRTLQWRQWIVEKNGYLSPAQARQAWHAAIQSGPPRETNLLQGTGCDTAIGSNRTPTLGFPIHRSIRL